MTAARAAIPNQLDELHFSAGDGQTAEFPTERRSPMSLGPLGGIASSAAGSPLAQTKGSDVERAEQDAANSARRTHADQKAENAAGIGEADGEDHETAERDADGRRLWEAPPEAQADDADHADEPHAADDPARSQDASGQCGNLLDLTG